MNGMPRLPAIDVIATTCPPPCERMIGSASSIVAIAPVRSVSIVRRARSNLPLPIGTE